jgi:hypothetical protein
MSRAGFVAKIVFFMSLSSFGWALSGSGSSGDPYVIANRTDFDAFCADSAYWALGVCTRLDADIDLTGTTYTNSPIAPDTIDGPGFFDGPPYMGQFNGNGHKIIGLKILSFGKDYVGLFGCIESGLVEKLAVVNCYIIPNSNSTSGSTDYAGPVCGNLFLGTIRYCYASGYISGGYIVGGLCGYSYGTIHNCYSLAVTKGVDYVGGLIGWASTRTTSNCFAAGEIYVLGDGGGLVGKVSANPTFTDCFWDMETSTQTISLGGTGLTNDQMRTQMSFTGAGWDFVGETPNGTADIWKMSHASGSTNGYPMLWWQTDNPDTSLTGSGTSVNPFVIASRANFDAFCANSYYWDDHIRLDVDLNLTGTTYTMAPVAPDTLIGPYDYKEDFEGIPFSGHFDGNNRSIFGLTIAGGDNCNLGLFGCVRYGDVFDLTISNCSISGNLRNIGGLCGSKLKYSYFTNCRVTGTLSGGTTADSRNVGAIAGYALSAGQISDCTANAVVSGYRNIGVFVGEHQLDGLGVIVNCASSGSASGTYSVGGFCGGNYANMADCFSDASVSGVGSVGGFMGYSTGGDAHLFILTVSGCYSTGPVTGSGEKIAGFCGTNQGYLDDCFTTSSVTALSGSTGYVGGFAGWNWNGRIQRCYSAGTITAQSGLANTAGFCGVNSDAPEFEGLFVNCFWNTQTSGMLTAYHMTDGPHPSQTGVCVGLTTDQMQQQSTFTAAGWDFVGETVNGTEDIWKMPVFGTNNNFPILSWITEVILDGSGTSADPYIIGSLADFLYYRSEPMLWSTYVRLDCNLDLSGIRYNTAPIAPDTNDAATGFQGVEFTGNFNGNRHRIVGLSIAGGTRDYIGLFGRVGVGGKVRNLDVRNGTLSGYDYLGGLCGDNSGTLEKCSAAGQVSGGSYSGGLTGRNDGTVTQCVSKSAVYGADYTGGLVGLNSSGAAIANCYALCHTTDVNTGGLVGLNDGGVSNSYANCAIDATEGPFGAFCGWTNGSGTFANCFYDKAYGNDLYAAGKTASQFLVRSTFVGWDFTGSKADGSFDYWHMPFWTNQGRPILNWQIDLMDIIDNWLTDEALCDLNEDGRVNLADLSIHAKE